MAAAQTSKRKINECGALLRDVPLAEIVQAIAVVEAWRRAHADPLAHISSDLRQEVGAAENAQRLKRFDTIVDKLRRHPRMNLSQMEDIAGARVTLRTQEQALHVADQLGRSSRWTIRRQRRYIDGGDPGPKGDGYRAIHLVVVRDSRFVEIQLRTRRQDAWAQSIEDDADHIGAAIKSGGGPDDLRKFHRMNSEYFAMLDAGAEPSQRFTEQLSERYAATRRHFERNTP